MESKNFYNNFVYDWWKNLDKVILLLFISLIIFWHIFLFESTSLIAIKKNNYYFFSKTPYLHIFRININYFFSAISEKNIYKIAMLFFILFFVSLLLVPIFGVEIKGSKRWLDFHYS